MALLSDSSEMIAERFILALKDLAAVLVFCCHNNIES
jgi:hypothetical protein